MWKKAEMNQFWLKLGAEMNYLPKDRVKEFYYGLIRVLVKGLRDEGIVEMPGWGKFGIIKFKGKRMKNIHGEGYVFCKDTIKLRYAADWRLKEYVKKKMEKKVIVETFD